MSVAGCSLSTEIETNYDTEIESNLEENMVLEIIGCQPPFPDFDLKTLLSTSPSGNNIITYYEKHKQLTAKHRNTLTDIMCRRIFTRVVNQ